MHVRAIASLGIVLALFSPPSASAQWDPRDEAVGRCQQELQYRMGREVGGRQPNASIDERRAQITRVSNTEARVRGNGRYMRDNNDRGRDFSFDCTFNSRNNTARATYNWSGPGWGGQYPDPDPGYNRPPSGGYPPDGRVFFSGGIVSRLERQMPGRRGTQQSQRGQYPAVELQRRLEPVVGCDRSRPRSVLDHQPGQQQGADRLRPQRRRGERRTDSAGTVATTSVGASSVLAMEPIASSACPTIHASMSRARSATTGRTFSCGAAAAAPIRRGYFANRS